MCDEIQHRSSSSHTLSSEDSSHCSTWLALSRQPVSPLVARLLVSSWQQRLQERALPPLEESRRYASSPVALYRLFLSHVPPALLTGLNSYADQLLSCCSLTGTGLEPLLFVRSESTRSPPSYSSASCLSKDWFARLRRISRLT